MRAGAATALAVLALAIALALAWRPLCAPMLLLAGADAVMRVMAWEFSIAAVCLRVGATGAASALMLPFVVVEADAPRGTVSGIVLALPDALWNLLWDELSAAELPPSRFSEWAVACAR